MVSLRLFERSPLLLVSVVRLVTGKIRKEPTRGHLDDTQEMKIRSSILTRDDQKENLNINLSPNINPVESFFNPSSKNVIGC